MKKYIFISIPLVLAALLFTYLNIPDIRARRYELNDSVNASMIHSIGSRIESTDRITKSLLSSNELTSFLKNSYTMANDYDYYMSSIQNYVNATINTDAQSDISIYMQNSSIPMSMDVFYHLEDISQIPAIQDFLVSDAIECWLCESDFDTASNPYLFPIQDRFIYLRKAYDFKKNFLGILAFSTPESYVLSFDVPGESTVTSHGHTRIINLSGETIPDDYLQDILSMKESHGRFHSLLAAKETPENFPFTIITVTKNNNYSQLILGFLFIFISFVFFSELSRRNIKKEKSNKETRLIALQHQINPHFIYNTMEVFSSKMKIYGHYEESDAMVAFANIFRYNISTNDALVCIHEEVRQSHNYMNVEKLRYPGIRLDVNIAPELNFALIPKFTLQPIIENAISHGMEDPKQDFPIELTVEKQDKELTVSILDRGCGMLPEQLNALLDRLQSTESISTDGHSVGLKNVNERLILYFGTSARLRVESRHKEYTKITFHIPYITK